MSEARRGGSVCLFSYGQLESKDETEEWLEKCHRALSTLTTNLREKEVFSQLSEKVSHSPQQHEEITLALLYSILTDPNAASKSYHTLLLITRDSMNQVVNMLERIIMEKMTKLQDTTRLQLLWLTRELVSSGVAGADKICFALLKHLPAGNVSTNDIYVADSVLNILLDHQEWLEGLPALVDSAVFTYLAILPSHNSQPLTSLRQQETQFCVSLIRAKLTDMLPIGRDLVRLLQGVARIPEFSELWKDLFQQPQTLSPQLTDIYQLLCRRTSRRFLAGRVLPEIEIKLNFLLSKVKFGQQKCYQEWFQKKYLSTPESLLIIPELIRFVCCVIHPPNEILQSDIVPRWAFIGWLLSLCQGNHVLLANAKLALFYDWLSYNPELDNIMNIEPGILLMTNSLRQHPQLSAMLIEFLCKLISSFSPALEQRVRAGVLAAFNDILSKEVILSVEPLFESSRFDDGLIQLIRNTFPEFYPQVPVPQPETTPSSIADEYDVTITSSVKQTEEGRSADIPVVIVDDEVNANEIQPEDLEVIGAFSDPEELETLGGGKGEESQGYIAIGSTVADERDVIIEDMEDEEEERVEEMEGVDKLSRLPESVRETLTSLFTEDVVLPAVLNDVLQIIRDQRNDLTVSDMSVIGDVVSEALENDFTAGFRPEDSYQLTQDTERPTTLLCRCASEDDSSLSLLVSVSHHQPRTGYFFLMFLLHHACDRLSQYRNYATQSSTHSTLHSTLIADLKECVENESSIFYDTLPLIYNKFAVELKQCDELLGLIVANIDPAHLHNLMQKLMMRDFVIFGKDKTCIQHLITSSLQLDSFEQFCVWQLLCAEGPDCSLVIPAIGTLDTASEHHEALSGAILFLRAEASGLLGVSELLLMPLQHSQLVMAAGSRWINSKPSKYAKYIAHFLEKCAKDTLPTALNHLQNITKHLKGNALFEAAEGVLTKALLQLFPINTDYQQRFEKLYQIVSSVNEPGETSIATKRPLLERLESKPSKKRRVINRDDLSDS